VKSERDAPGKTERNFFPRVRVVKYAAEDSAVMLTGKAILNQNEPVRRAEEPRAPSSTGSTFTRTRKCPRPSHITSVAPALKAASKRNAKNDNGSFHFA